MSPYWYKWIYGRLVDWLTKEKGTPFLNSRFPTSEYQWNDGVWKSPFGNHDSNNCFRQKLESMDIKLMGENLMRNKIHSPTACFFFLIKKEKNVIWLEKPGKKHFNQVIKVNVGGSWTNRYYLALDLWEGHNITSLIVLLKIHNLNLAMEKPQRNPHWETVYKNKWPLLIKNVKIMFTIERQRSYSK